MCKFRPTLTGRLILAACLTGVREHLCATFCCHACGRNSEQPHHELPPSWTRAGLLSHNFVFHWKMHSGFKGSISGICVDFGQIVLMETSNSLNNSGVKKFKCLISVFLTKKFQLWIWSKVLFQNLCSFLFLIKAFNKLKEETRHFILSLVMGCARPYSDIFMALWFAENF